MHVSERCYGKLEEELDSNVELAFKNVEMIQAIARTCYHSISLQQLSSLNSIGIETVVASLNRTFFALQVKFCNWLCITRSSGKAPVAKRDYNSPVTLKGWLYRQVSTVTCTSSGVKWMEMQCVHTAKLYYDKPYSDYGA